jgi:FKBP-type peptidyl-prolyl cis-trans isomerase FklB
MIRTFLTSAIVICSIAGLSAQGSAAVKPAKGKPKPAEAAPAAPAFKLITRQDSIGYAIGVDIASNLKKQGIELSIEALAQAMRDANAGTPLMDAPQSQAVLMKMQQDMRAKTDAERKAKSSVNLQKAEAFLAENKTKPGVITLPNGLQYLVLKEGTGVQPTSASSVTTHYHGTLMDGTVFDSSVQRGQPATFQVGGVISAWQQMLVLMKEGGKVRLFCPPGLAYGEQGSGPKIGPNELLIFEIELIKVN